MSEKASILQLTPAERNSPLWHALTAHWGQRLAALRAANDGALGETETASTRGRIAEIKAMLAIEDRGYKP